MWVVHDRRHHSCLKRLVSSTVLSIIKRYCPELYSQVGGKWFIVVYSRLVKTLTEPLRNQRNVEVHVKGEGTIVGEDS